MKSGDIYRGVKVLEDRGGTILLEVTTLDGEVDIIELDSEGEEE